MKEMTMRMILLALALAGTVPATAQPFGPGPVFKDFGKIAAVPDPDLAIPANAEFKVAFDVVTAAGPGQVNRSFDSAARFINMHVAAGVPADRIRVALVIHGSAVYDVTGPTAYAAKYPGARNGSAAAIAALVAHGVDIYLCGQSAARAEVKKADLLPGVKLALSAMTAHALLQQRGYTLNPF